MEGGVEAQSRDMMAALQILGVPKAILPHAEQTWIIASNPIGVLLE